MDTVNFSFNPLSGGIDKYKVTLYNASGTSVLQTQEYTPSFAATITGSFAGVTNGTTYKVSLTEYIGTLSKECPLKTIVASSGGGITVFFFTFGETEADTTGIPLTESEYVTSVNNAIASGNVYNNGQNIGAATVTVNEFNNASDKVLFISVPSTEAAFTKWSEVGNIYQQNQPIDASFGGGNVWFKSVDGASTYYITRSQTDFAGAVVLSR